MAGVGWLPGEAEKADSVVPLVVIWLAEADCMLLGKPWVGRWRTSSISSMGVMPAIGALLNWPMRYQRGPSRLLPMYTGLPLIPSTTPVYSGFVPWSRTRIMSWPGPRAPRNTPRISTSIGSGLLPEKTVHAVPVMPARTWLRGNTPPVDGGGPAVACAWNAESAAGTGFCARRETGHIRATWTPASVTATAARRKMDCFRRHSTSIRVQREDWFRASSFQLPAFSLFVGRFAVTGRASWVSIGRARSQRSGADF